MSKETGSDERLLMHKERRRDDASVYNKGSYHSCIMEPKTFLVKIYACISQ